VSLHEFRVVQSQFALLDELHAGHGGDEFRARRNPERDIVGHGFGVRVVRILDAGAMLKNDLAGPVDHQGHETRDVCGRRGGSIIEDCEFLSRRSYAMDKNIPFRSSALASDDKVKRGGSSISPSQEV
jgi:hypothetical protein